VGRCLAGGAVGQRKKEGSVGSGETKAKKTGWQGGGVMVAGVKKPSNRGFKEEFKSKVKKVWERIV